MSGTSDAEEMERWKARVGSTIRNKWTIDALLGVGGMAAVYAATHKIGRRDAIKILHPEVAVSRELRARFQQEALAVGKLGHPGAVQVLDVDVTEDGAPFLVMELLDGENLGQRAYKLGGIPEAELFGYADQLLDVLGAAHALGIIHRDIKPDNLFITKDGRLKVLDFGIARMKSGGSGLKTRTGAMMGTTSYMAPEQIHGRQIDGRADIFAVGATLFRILAKRRLHEATTDADLLVKMGSAQAPPIRSVAPSVSPGAARVIDLAVAFEADRRYQDAAAMRTDVQAVLRGEDPPIAASVALRTEAPTSAGGVAAAPLREPTGVTQAAGPPSTHAIAAAPAAMAPVVAFEPTAAPPSATFAPVAPGPQSVHAQSPGPFEQTSGPMVLARTSATVPEEDRSKTPVALLAVIGGAMLLLGIGAGAWLMLSGDRDRESVDKIAASRTKAPSIDAETGDGAESKADKQQPSNGEEEPSSSPTGTPAPAPTVKEPAREDPGKTNPRVPSTTEPAPTGQVTPPKTQPTVEPPKTEKGDDKKKGKEKKEKKKGGKGGK